MKAEITESDISALREKVRDYLTEKRYAHTLAVEREAQFLGGIYLPEKIKELRCAALLHDITKKCDLEKQLKYCAEFDIIVGDYDILSPKTFHAKTASALIKRAFPDFATPDIVSGVRWHTTGHDNMTVFEAIVYLADYIDDTRKYDECILLRNMFWDADIENMTMDERLSHLDKVVLKSLDITISDLIEGGKVINRDTVAARNDILKKIKGRG